MDTIDHTIMTNTYVTCVFPPRVKFARKRRAYYVTSVTSVFVFNRESSHCYIREDEGSSLVIISDIPAGFFKGPEGTVL